MCNKKEWWWCQINTGVKYNPGEYHIHLPKKCIGISNKIGGGDYIQSGGNNLKLERSTAEVIDHEYDPEDNQHNEENELWNCKKGETNPDYT